MERLLSPPITFAHRGARAHAPGNTLQAFALALRLGATGLESDVRLTADGVPVLHHDRAVKVGIRRRPIAGLVTSALPDHVPSLRSLYEECGSDFELSLDIYDPDAVPAAVEVARSTGPGTVGRMWLCHPDVGVLGQWRRQFPDVRLVNSTRLRSLPRGAEHRAAQLSDIGVDAVNLHYSEWTGGHVALFHRFGRLAFAWDAQYERVLRSMLRIGIDGVFSDHVDRMVEVVGVRPERPF